MANLQTTCITGHLNISSTTASPSIYRRMWYDPTLNQLKYSYCGGTWSTGGNLTFSRVFAGSSKQGTSNSSLMFGGCRGNTFPGTCILTCTEEYNGSSWSTGGAMIREMCGNAGAGTQNAALSIGGFYPQNSPLDSRTIRCTDEYNGSTWSVGGALSSVCRRGIAGLGSQNAALAAGGVCVVSPVGCTEEYNGSTWATGGALGAISTWVGAGTQNAGLVFFGLNSCEYDGTSWSAGGCQNINQTSGGGGGTQNAAFIAGGDTILTCTEEYNGSTWSIGGALITGRSNLGSGDGGPTNGIIAGGFSPANPPQNTFFTVTEEFTPALRIGIL
jgi:hypothetical protein